MAGTKPCVLFVCIHNAGRSQMAAAYLQSVAGDRIDVWSAGSNPAGTVNPQAVAVMAEVGIDIATEKPKRITSEVVQTCDIVVTMGCGDSCPFYPDKRYEDWELDDPAGKSIDAVRVIRDEIKRRVDALVRSVLGPAPLL